MPSSTNMRHDMRDTHKCTQANVSFFQCVHMHDFFLPEKQIFVRKVSCQTKDLLFVRARIYFWDCRDGLHNVSAPVIHVPMSKLK